MRQFSARRLIRLFMLFVLGSVILNAAQAQGIFKPRTVPTPVSYNFCVIDPVARASGTVQTRAADCPAGYTSQGGSCKREAETRPALSAAPECPAGYKVNGATCQRPALSKPNPGVRAADCPDGYSNSGNACFRLSAPDPLPASRMSCKPGETKLDARCYKPCEAGSTSAGANCVRPASTLAADKMSCKAGFQLDEKKGRCMAQCAAGFSNSGDACVRAADTLGPESMSCKAGETRQGTRCVAAVATCAKGEVMQGGACFAACAPGFEGVGGACWPQPPKAWVACGIGAAMNAASCAAAKFEQLAQLKHLAVGLGRDGNAVPGPGQQVTRLIALHAKFRDLAAAYNSVKDTPQFKRDLAAWQAASQGKDAFTPFDDSGAQVTEAAMMRHAVQLAAIAGASGGVNTSAHPKCSELK